MSELSSSTDYIVALAKWKHRWYTCILRACVMYMCALLTGYCTAFTGKLQHQERDQYDKVKALIPCWHTGTVYHIAFAACGTLLLRPDSAGRHEQVQSHPHRAHFRAARPEECLFRPDLLLAPHRQFHTRYRKGDHTLIVSR